MLRIALPNKGRLAEDVRELFNDAGLEVRSQGDRALSASLGGEFEAIFVRSQDIPEFVADGAADAGVTGWDLISESGRQLEMLIDLEFGRCRLVVAARDDSGIASIEQIRPGARVATSFPSLSRSYFQKVGRQVEIVPVSGAAEIAPHLGIADIVVDLTSTGSTFKVNGLQEIATILESSARLFTAVWPLGSGQPLDSASLRSGRAEADSLRSGRTEGASLRSGRAGGASPEKKRALDDLVMALASVIRARDKRYLMANVPRATLEKVRDVLPGLKGPTVVDILDGGAYVAVHAVVSAGSVYRTIASLKALGCEGILVTRIERLMP